MYDSLIYNLSLIRLAFLNMSLIGMASCPNCPWWLPLQSCSWKGTAAWHFLRNPTGVPSKYKHSLVCIPFHCYQSTGFNYSYII